MSASAPPCVLFLVTEDWYFVSHRLGLARAARAAGWRVVVAARESEYAETIRASGAEFVALPFERALTYPWRDLRLVWSLRGLFAAVRPDVLHLVSLKPILLGGLALPWAGPRCAPLLAFTGLGYVFSSGSGLARLLRPLVLALLARIARRPRAWVLAQNTDDLALLLARGIGQASRASIIGGAGVDPDDYPASPLPPRAGAIVLMPARVLRDKGVEEFVAAAALLRARHPDVRCVIAGAHDRDNPGAVDADELARWVASGAIEWWGARRDMAAVYRQAYIVCLPSWREGLPRALLEAAAAARPLVATDVPGCREICIDGETGLSVPPRDPPALAAALARLLDDEALAERCAAGAHARLRAQFTLESVARGTLDLYAELRAAP